MFKRLFSGDGKDKKDKKDDKDKKDKDKKDKKSNKGESIDDPKRKSGKSKDGSGSTSNPDKRRSSEKKPSAPKPKPSGGGGSGGGKKNLKRKKQQKKNQDRKIDVNKPLEWPCEPELILEYHKAKSFLTPNEEWFLVELNEFECLVDSQEILSIMAQHTKYTEMEPDEYLEEFFEFVDDVSTYDEIINYDVWQEFRDVKYPC